MSIRLINKPVGGKPKTFTIKGLVVGHAFIDHKQEFLMLRAFLRSLDQPQTYVFELLHTHEKRLIESICNRDGYRDKHALVEAVWGAVLQVEADPAIRVIVDGMRESVTRQIEAFNPPPVRMGLLMPNYVGSKGSNKRR